MVCTISLSNIKPIKKFSKRTYILNEYEVIPNLTCNVLTGSIATTGLLPGKIEETHLYQA